LSNVEEAMVSELRISAEEARAFLLIVMTGSMTAQRLAELLRWTPEHAESVAKSLVSLGMVIELAPSKYESLHPRFAITNRYRRRCQEENLQFKKNLRVDNIGIVLEKPYDDARTK
jgi:sugar-specific transcriptional regulator TrmB